jgi:hypothetical protein
MSMAKASASMQWQQQQKGTATSTQVKRPDIPGDYGGQAVPDLPPGTENFVGVRLQSTTWYLTVAAATVAMALICVINLKRR